jgi:hypothetical protein
MMEKVKDRYHFNVNGGLSSVKKETLFTSRAVVLQEGLPSFILVDKTWEQM